MFTLLGIAWVLVTALALWFLAQLWRFWKLLRDAGSMTVQVMTHEERKAEEEFVEHARARAWKALYLEVGN